MTVAQLEDADVMYTYTDRTGAAVLQVVRRPGKRFLQRRRDGDDWAWGRGDTDPVPYRWPDLERAIDNGDPVFVVEGEKDADRLASLGLAATTSPGGAAWQWPHTWADHFRGCAQVVVIADNDTAGRAAAHQRAAIVHQAVNDVRIVDQLPGVGPKGDVSDYLDAGHTIDDLWRVADSAPSWQPAAGTGDTEPNDTEPNSWQPVDIAALRARGVGDQPAPTILARSDGAALVYAGKTHSFNGESESGKSWGALLACLGEVRVGRTVTYLDFEDDADTVVGRMLALGATWDDLERHFLYARPVEPIPVGQIIDIAQQQPSLVVIDGVTEAMALHDLDPDKNRDSAKFMKLLVRPLAHAGAAVVQVDHVTKNPEQRGKYAIGAQHKRAAITGAMYTFAVTKPFGRGLSGVIAITVEKDKPGHVRRSAAGRKAAELHIASNPDGTIVTADLRAPGATSSQPFRPTVLMERVSRQLEDAGEAGLTKNSLKAAVKGNNDHIGLAAEVLEAEGYVTVHQEGQARKHVSVRPYRQADDAPADHDRPEEQ